MLTVFVDESGADGNNRFLVHGALFVRGHVIEHMRARIQSTLDRHGLPDELKWTSSSLRTVERNIEAVAAFFHDYSRDPYEPATRFQCLVVDQHRVNTRVFHAGDRDMCFYKLLYQLLVKRIAEVAGPREEVHVVLDKRNTRRYDLQDLATVLGHGLLKSRGIARPLIKSLEYRDSSSDPMLQVADFLAGAVCFYQNGRHMRAESSPAKLRAAAAIAEMCLCSDLCATQRRDPKFGIWTIRLKDRAA